jgi:hypothetical protein
MYYVYALLDPRKPGAFRYALGSGRFATFDHEPFYIGKGKGNRIRVHVPTALLGVEQTFKARRIRRIHAQGFSVIEKKSKRTYDEAEAFEFERMLIQAIGRQDLKKGPLCNLTDGGDGVPNLNAEARKRISKSSQNWWKNMTPAERMVKIHQYQHWWTRLTPEGRAAFIEQKRKDTKSHLAGLSDVEYFAYVQTIKDRVQDWWANLTPTQRVSYSVKQSIAQTKRWASVNNSDRALIGRKVQDTINNTWDIERYALRTERKRASAKDWYESLSADAKQEMKRKQDEAKRNYPVRICPHCGTSGKGGNMVRYHFDNCKQRG